MSDDIVTKIKDSVFFFYGRDFRAQTDIDFYVGSQHIKEGMKGSSKLLSMYGRSD